MDKVEHWLKVDGAPFLEVSSLGRIRRLERFLVIHGRRENGTSIGNFRRLIPAAIVPAYLALNGYLYVTQVVDGVTKKYAVHRLVAKAYCPGYFDGATVDHLDFCRTNNVPENLEWVSRSENTRRQNAMGRGVPKGEKHPNAKLSDSDIDSIFSLRAEGKTYLQIASVYGVSLSLIQLIIKGKRRSKTSS